MKVLLAAFLLSAAPAFAADTPPQRTVAQLQAQVAELSAELRAVKAQRDALSSQYLDAMAALAAQRQPQQPPVSRSPSN